MSNPLTAETLLSLEYGISKDSIQLPGLIMQGTVIYPPWNRFQYVPACDFPVHHVSDNISIYRHKNALFSIMECHTTLLLTKELIL